MRVLLLNAGSSSLKCTLVEAADRRVVGRVSVDWAGATTHYARSGPTGAEVREEVAFRGHADAVPRALDDLLPAGGAGSLAAVGHRVVHGGEFTASVRITDEVRSRISALVELAPLHNPPGLETLAAAEARLPDVPHVAVFDTAFHSGLPPAARTYGVPEAWTRDWGIRRYGFHGSSYAWSTGRAAEMLARPAEALRLVICHLGHGCSAAAVLGGRSVDTTMGFTPLEGLVMATRSGSLDPGAVLHVQRQQGLTAEEIEQVLNHESGLLGVSGVSGDMREVLAAARAGNERASLALDLYTYRVRQAIGALAAALSGLDALVFTGGVGENAALVRERSCRGLGFLGVELDEAANRRCTPDVDVARAGSPVRVLVIAAREDLAMLAEVMKVMKEMKVIGRKP